MKVPRDEYMNLYRRFNPVKWDPDALLQPATAAGMKYAVRHQAPRRLHHVVHGAEALPRGRPFLVHYCISDTPYGKDLVRMMQQAAQKHGMRLGWYYSTRDWTHPDYLQGDNQAYNAYYETRWRNCCATTVRWT
ncbi:MAG: alpha-L-fucosidase [Kiritimatiellia bacterium]